ncbi:MAG: DUF4347 domain-containing protein, partial [Gammaproteobacteria bacterium]|nr:DUF4347 domain-containing protein [Gammaproteobacteria bacterium]NIW01050.1 DUF4347 domain-containing protein [Gammaproteobacteria bacterium]NIW53995.1 DUF4347 domain-containing protein [Gammaproteobacteria bacterium]NIX03241.1 DUF4347 domain-containing protein [Gammaproteobacteria bacterium]
MGKKSNHSQSQLRAARAVMEELEPRLLFSADLPGIALDPDPIGIDLPPPATVISQDSASDDTRTGEPSRATDAQRRELVFIDAEAPNYQQLIRDLTEAADQGRNISIVVLDSDRDGIEQITEALTRYRDLDAVHVVSHGSDASLQLGNRRLDQSTLLRYAHRIQTWGEALNDQADLLLYGCDLAGSAQGQSLIDRLATLTGADVAASDDLTGQSAQGGDWELEYRAGDIETEVAFSVEVRESWNGVLSTANLAPIEDTYIDNNNNTTNFGSSSGMTIDKSGGGAGNQRALLKFDLSFIPAGATINSATLTMEATSIDGALNIDIYEILENWSETTATWNDRDTGTSWTDAGGTYNPTAEATLNTNSTGQHTWDISALVQAWVDGTSANNGILIGSPDTGTNVTATYESREGSVGPILTIDYTVPPGETYFLDDDTSGDDTDSGTTTPDAALKLAAPTDAILENYDPGRDAQPGIVIVPTALGFSETDPTKYQAWAIRIPGGTTINDPVRFTIWTAMKDFDTTKAGSIEASLFYANASPTLGTLNEITSVVVERPDWDIADAGTWIETTFDFGIVNHTLTNNQWLGVSVSVNNGGATAIDAEDSMWFAYDAVGYPARLEIGSNTPPGNIVPGTQTVNENTPLVFSSGNNNLIAVSDTDDVNNPLQVSLKAANGTMTLSTTLGLTFSVGTGAGDTDMVFTGSIADINAALDGMSFNPLTGFDGAASIEITTDDLGNSGIGGALSDVDTVDINVVGTNDPPKLDINAGVTVDEGASVTITNAMLAASDPDNTPDQIRFSLKLTAVLAKGRLELDGVTLNPGDWFSQEDIDFGRLVYIHDGSEVLAPDTDTFAFAIDDGFAFVPEDIFTITLNPVNDAPTATNLSAAETYTEDTSLDLTDIVVSDVDSANVTVTLTLSDPAAGSLSTATVGTVTSTFAAGVWTASGAIGDVNALLDGVTFNPALNYNSDFTIATSVDDGVAPALTGIKTMTALPINDPPTATNLNQVKSYTEGDASVALDDIVVSDVDSANITVTLTLSDPATGTLTAASGNGESYNTVSGLWTVTGTLAQVNAALAAVTFLPATENDVSTTITTHVEDQSGAAPPDGTITLNVTPVNDPATF